MLILLRQGRLSKWFSGIGQEAIAVGVTAALRPDDPILPMHRNLGVFTARGLDLLTLFRQLLGRDGGYTRGRDRTFHFGAPAHHIDRHDQPPRRDAAGGRRHGLGFQLKGEAPRRGDVHRRGRHDRGRLPRSGQPCRRLEAAGHLRHREQPVRPLDAGGRAVRLRAAVGSRHRLRHRRRNGRTATTCSTVVEAIARAAARARAGEGPTLLEFMTFRMRGHEEASGTAYVPKHLFDEWARKIRSPASSSGCSTTACSRWTSETPSAPRSRRTSTRSPTRPTTPRSPIRPPNGSWRTSTPSRRRDAATSQPRCRDAATPRRRSQPSSAPPPTAKREAPPRECSEPPPRERSERAPRERPRGAAGATSPAERSEAPPRAPPRAQRAPAREVRYIDAISDGLRAGDAPRPARHPARARTSPSTAEPSR